MTPHCASQEDSLKLTFHLWYHPSFYCPAIGWRQISEWIHPARLCASEALYCETLWAWHSEGCRFVDREGAESILTGLVRGPKSGGMGEGWIVTNSAQISIGTVPEMIAFNIFEHTVFLATWSGCGKLTFSWYAITCRISFLLPGWDWINNSTASLIVFRCIYHLKWTMSMPFASL